MKAYSSRKRRKILSKEEKYNRELVRDNCNLEVIYIGWALTNIRDGVYPEAALELMAAQKCQAYANGLDRTYADQYRKMKKKKEQSK